MTWLGPTPHLRWERHYSGRLLRCFADRPASVNAMLAGAVARNATGVALVCGPRRLSYETLDDEIGRLAAGFTARGVVPGDRVALLLPNSVEFVLTLLAVLRIGAVAVPLNVREGPRELAFVLADSGAKTLLYDTALAGSLPPPAETPALRDRLGIHSTNAASDLGRLYGAVCVPQAAIVEEALAAILYTSGTTGRPKGAMLTHLSIVHAALIYASAMGLGDGERSVASVPLSHVTGLTAGIALMLHVAGTLIVMPSFKADAFIRLAAAERMTHTVMVPAMYNLCLLGSEIEHADLSPWRIGGYGGAPMPAVTIDRLAARLPNLRLFNAYGSTETTGPVVLMPPGESRGRSIQVGRAVPTTEILIMDERGCEAAPGESGEIWLKGPNVVPGYWGNPAATSENFIEGYWRSGDIGSLDADGFLTLLDRSKDMVNRGGFKIYSVEVENVLASHAEVVEAAVVARPCPVLGERVHAFVVPRAGFADAQALKRHAAERLADYKVPETLTFLADPLPRNAGGKVLKRELRLLVT